MEYSEENYNITIEANRIKFDGTLSIHDYSYVYGFLKEVNTAEYEHIILDLTSLDYLNSIGMCSFADFFRDCQKEIKIITNNKNSWQKAGIPVLQSLLPGKIEII